MYVVWAIVGAIVGGLVGQGFAGAVAGFAIGLLWARTSELSRDLAEAMRRLAAVTPKPTEASERRDDSMDWRPVTESASNSPESRPQPTPAVQPPLPVSEPVAAVSAPAPTPIPTVSVPIRRVPPPMPGESAETYRPPVHTGPTGIERAAAAAKRWFTEGNVPVKVGMLVLFAGIAAFLKYASDIGLLRVPMSVRLALVALFAIGGVAFGWMQREKRRSFALSLQGGALGVLVMTVFAAYRLYGLIGSIPAFGLLVVFVAGLCLLAVLQDALALAVLGLIAGFAAPIIASSGQGNHVALFSYYAVLNIAILGIAWKRSWRVLNVLGFVATFGVGTAWGALRYDPGLFNSTEPFLILFFLLYLAVPWLHVLRSPDRSKAILDGCLMFGNPIASLFLQAALLDWEPVPLAISALVAAAIYVAIAFAIRKREGMGLLRETWAVLAVAFATIAVPLALSAAVTASVFAIEGAGLIWLGFRQSRRLPRWAGVFLQLLAAAAWAVAAAFHNHYNDVAILNAQAIGALLLVIGAVAGVWQFDHHGRSQGVSSIARIGLALWALLWWLIGAGREIDTFVFGDDHTIACWMAVIGVTAWPVAEACRRARKLDLGLVLAFIVPASFIAFIPLLQWSYERGVQPLAGYALLAMALTAVSGWFAMRAIGQHRVAAVAANVTWWLRWLAVAWFATTLALRFNTAVGSGWTTAALVVPTLLLMTLMLWWPRVLVAPLSAHAGDIRPALGALLLFGTTLIGLGLLGVDGSSRPLPFVPVINPVDLLLIAVLALGFRAMSDSVLPEGVRAARPVVFAVCFFAFATSVTLRAVHHLGGVPWDGSMLGSSLAQLSLTVVWSVIGVLAWVLGSRRGQRMLWMAGACIMGLVLAKLLLVDRGHLGNLFGIGSFMAYGLLCTVIGYLAPAPPRQVVPPSPEPPHAS
ncbi:MAG: hypothetical protein GAK28_04845 [Luteibacter sp.]|uniref:DUF2339 domain-containing protein n=1 Tax=Luteibacter sp. TaxID=1886636 RepID=UPI00138443E6|nr:DUF2339 domain-containing protein [Luteibacter sp.]KAF1003238.1 MAG: hypothetical protein GAK28_04845 [Luteibacter sp.]